MPKNYAEAARWYQKAADQGDAGAQTNLGSAYANGHGVPQNQAEAVLWWKKAADQGDANAQFRLGFAYFHGQGVAQDQAEAYFWADLAATLNQDAKGKSAAKLRDSIAATLTQVQLSAVQKKCRQWMDAFDTRKVQWR